MSKTADSGIEEQQRQEMQGMTHEVFAKKNPSLIEAGLKVEAGSLCHCNGVSRYTFEEFLQAVARTQTDNAVLDIVFKKYEDSAKETLAMGATLGIESIRTAGDHLHLLRLIRDELFQEPFPRVVRVDDLKCAIEELASDVNKAQRTAEGNAVIQNNGYLSGLHDLCVKMKLGLGGDE